MDKSVVLRQIMARHQTFYLEISNAALAPMVIIFTRSGENINVILEGFPDLGVAEEKISEVVQEHDGVQLAFISESWIVIGKPEDVNMDIAPSENPNRIEAVVTVVIDQSGSVTGIQRIDRDETGKIVSLTTLKEGGEETISDGFLEGIFRERRTLH